MGDACAIEHKQAFLRHANAHEHLGELGLAIAADAREPIHLAGAQAQRQPIERDRTTVAPRLQAAQLEPHRARADALDRFIVARLAHHDRGELFGRVGRGRPAGLDRAPAAHHRDAIGKGEHLAQLVRDDDDARPFARQPSKLAEEALRFLVGQHRGRLVENQDLCAADHRLDDLDPLLLRDRELIDPRIGVDGEADARADLGDLFANMLEALAIGAAAMAKHDVLGHRHARHQLEMLVHHADAERARGERPFDRDRLAIDL